MLLAVDIGNTHTVLGLYEDTTLISSWRFPTSSKATSDELSMSLFTLLKIKNLDLSSVDASVLSSVVPALTHVWCSAIRSLTSSEPLLCSATTAASLFKTDYPNPEEIGADRIADVVACKEIYGYPAIVVDFGTATNLEVIDDRGYFIGGLIAPGMQTSASTLFSQGAQLAAVDLDKPEHIIGRNTREALESGIMFGEACRVDGLIRRVWEELGYKTKVIATGGLAVQIAGISDLLDTVNSDLTLEGLRLISEANS